MALDPRAFPAVSATLRSYMHLDPSDHIDLAVMAAIVSNFAPDRVNPLWFVLIAAPESGKSMLLDVLLTNWPESFTIQSALTPAYFISGKPGKLGVLGKIDREKRRILHMNDMGGLLTVTQRDREILHAQLIGIYDGYVRRETGLGQRANVHKRTLRTRLGWVGAATELFYDRFLRQTFALGARFTPFYWQPARGHWSEPTHLAAQRALRGQQLLEFGRVRTVMQQFLNTAIEELHFGFKDIECGPAACTRIDSAVALAMRVSGGQIAPPGGRTADRAVQFARTCAYLHGEYEVNELHADLAVHMVLSQMHPYAQHLIAYASLPTQLHARAWTFTGFLRHVGAPAGRYLRMVPELIDIGVLTHVGKVGWNGGTLSLTFDARKLIERFNPRASAASLALMATKPAAEVATVSAPARASKPKSAPVPLSMSRFDLSDVDDECRIDRDDPSEVSMDELEKLGGVH